MQGGIARRFTKNLFLRPDRDNYVKIIDENVDFRAKVAMKIKEKDFGETFNESGGNIYFI